MDSNNDNVVGRIDGKGESKVTVVLGALWGDEGKGKVVDMLAVDADVVCRCQGGSNADHNVVVDGIEYNFHLLPVGIIHPNCISVIGNGVIVHLPGLFVELQKNIAKGLMNWEERLVISDRSHLVFDFHQQVDGYQEQEASNNGQFIGTTKRGIGPTYSSKVTRNGITVGELLGDFSRFSEKFRILVAMYKRLFPNLVVNIDEELAKYAEYAKTIRPYVDNTVYLLDDCIKRGKKVIVEAANAAMLDIDFGTYPYVTSSNSSVGGVCTGLGIPPIKIGEVIGVFKSYVSRVGEGPFPTELNDEIGKLLQKRGREVGVTTGRTRRCGWLDLFLLKYTHVINGYTALCLTKLDILDTLPEVKLGIGYTLHGEKLNRFPSSTPDLASVEVQYLILPGWLTSTENVKIFADLPENAQKYIKTIQEFLEVPIKWVATGRSRESIIKMF